MSWQGFMRSRRVGCMAFLFKTFPVLVSGFGCFTWGNLVGDQSIGRRCAGVKATTNPKLSWKWLQSSEAPQQWNQSTKKKDVMREADFQMDEWVGTVRGVERNLKRLISNCVTCSEKCTLGEVISILQQIVQGLVHKDDSLWINLKLHNTHVSEGPGKICSL